MQMAAPHSDGPRELRGRWEVTPDSLPPVPPQPVPQRRQEAAAGRLLPAEEKHLGAAALHPGRKQDPRPKQHPRSRGACSAHTGAGLPPSFQDSREKLH